MSKAEIGSIGGSGLYNMDGLSKLAPKPHPLPHEPSPGTGADVPHTS